MDQPNYFRLPNAWPGLAAREPDCVLLESSRCDGENHRSFLFRQPVAVLAIESPDELPSLFQRIEQHLARGHYLAGYFGYECGYHFERVPHLRGPLLGAKPDTRTSVMRTRPTPLPLAWFGVYEHPTIFSHASGMCGGAPVAQIEGMPQEFAVEHCRLEIAAQEYAQKIRRIREYIAAGDTYQVNFTDRVSFAFRGSPAALYASLRERQRVAYSALLHAGGHYVLSFSPELFFRIIGRKIITRPMKGTTGRGRDFAEDAERAAWLNSDPKNCSENVMIVDLLRNDLGRICEIGSVRVEDMFKVERYQTLLQMTSTVSGTLRHGLSWYEIFRAIFPCGSITGAPKVRTMQIIRELERQPRGIYTGAIGFFAPGGEAVFNVAIRTVVLAAEGPTLAPDCREVASCVSTNMQRVGPPRGWMGVGGGIVYDSAPDDEYRECCLKAEFLTRPVETFALLESILWNGEYALLEGHLRRLAASCQYFEFPFERAAVMAALQANTRRLRAGNCYKVRLLLDHNGQIRVENGAIAKASERLFWVEQGFSPAIGQLAKDAASAAEVHLQLMVSDVPQRLKPGSSSSFDSRPEGLLHPLANNAASACPPITFSPVRTSSADVFLYHKTTRRELYASSFAEAQQVGYADVIFMNERDEITEGARNNIFIEKNGEWLTPPVRCGLLPGVYRAHVLATHPRAQERVLRREDLQSADAIYLCNSVRGLRRVSLALAALEKH